MLKRISDAVKRKSDKICNINKLRSLQSDFQDTEKHNDVKEDNNVGEGWVWVEGYKGTDENIKCNDYQYQVGSIHKHEGDIVLCGKGFHFCEKLEDVFDYYPINFKNRFFKVQALVRKGDYSNMQEKNGNIVNPHGLPAFRIPYSHRGYDSKLVTKEIVFLNELDYNEMEKYIVDKYHFVDSKYEYNSINNYHDFVESKFLNTMNLLGFSESYSIVKLDDLNSYNDVYLWLERAKAYVEEDIGRDMLIYLLEK